MGGHTMAFGHISYQHFTITEWRMIGIQKQMMIQTPVAAVSQWAQHQSWSWSPFDLQHLWHLHSTSDVPLSMTLTLGLTSNTFHLLHRSWDSFLILVVQFINPTIPVLEYAYEQSEQFGPQQIWLVIHNGCRGEWEKRLGGDLDSRE